MRFPKRRDGTRHDVCVFSRCFPSVPPVNPNLLTVYNHMDVNILCCDLDPDSSNILESDKVHSKLHNRHIIAISQLDAVWLCHSQGGRLYSAEKFPVVLVGRADHCGDFCRHKHFVSKSFTHQQALCFWAEMWRGAGRIEERTDASLCTTVVFFSSIPLRQLQLLCYFCLVM